MEQTPENKPTGNKKGVWKGPEHLANRSGRPPGLKNKKTEAVRHAYQQLVEGNLENLSLWLNQVAADNPERAFELVIKLSEYVLPKLARTEVTGANGDDLFKNVKFEFGPSVDERLNEITDVDYEE